MRTYWHSSIFAIPILWPYLFLMYKYSSINFNKCIQHHSQNIEHIHHLRKFPVFFCSPFTNAPQVITELTFIILLSLCFRTLYKWNHTVYSNLCLAAFAWHKVFEIHPCRVFQSAGPFSCWAALHCIRLPQCASPFLTCWWAPWLCPVLGFNE